MRKMLAIAAGLGLLTFAPIASAETSGEFVKEGSYQTTGERSGHRLSRRHGQRGQKFHAYRSHDSGRYQIRRSQHHRRGHNR